MRVVVVGATGNVGTSVLRSLENEERVESVLGVARRLPGLRMPTPRPCCCAGLPRSGLLRRRWPAGTPAAVPPASCVFRCRWSSW